MAELPPNIAGLIEAARRAHDPTETDCERVRKGLQVAIAAQAPVAPAGASESAAGATGPGPLGSLLTSTGGKLLIAVALMGGASGIWTFRGESRHAPSSHETPRARMVQTQTQPALSPPASAVAAPASAHGERPSDRDRAGAAAQMLPPPSSAIEPPSRPRPVRARPSATALQRAERDAGAPHAAQTSAARAQTERSAESVARAARAARVDRPSEAAAASASGDAASEQVASSPAPASRESPKESEVTLIRAALASLNTGDPERALELLELHAARHALGAMARERAGLRVLALCAAGRSQEGRREQAAFLSAASDSPLQGRVRRACAESGVDARGSAGERGEGEQP